MADTGKVGWFIAGACVGVATALLLAPKSGEDTRNYLNEAAKDGRDAVASGSREVLERGRELYERGRQLAEDAADLFERGRKLVEG